MLECVALKAAMTMPSLLLQHPYPHSNIKEDMYCLERRLPLWIEGDNVALVAGGQVIHDSLGSTGSCHKSNGGDCRAVVLLS